MASLGRRNDSFTATFGHSSFFVSNTLLMICERTKVSLVWDSIHFSDRINTATSFLIDNLDNGFYASLIRPEYTTFPNIAFFGSDRRIKLGTYKIFSHPAMNMT